MYVWFHRELPAEERVPFAIEVVYRDAHVLVADKPHFLATTPRGSHVAETALARLRRELDLPALTAAHRLDRLTAGLVLFTLRPEERSAYQTLFRDRRVHKEYEALAPYDPALALPRTVRSRLVKERGELRAREVPGEPNAVSRVELVEHDGTVGRYRLLPAPGRRTSSACTCARWACRSSATRSTRWWNRPPRPGTSPGRCGCWPAPWSSPTR